MLHWLHQKKSLFIDGIKKKFINPFLLFFSFLFFLFQHKKILFFPIIAMLAEAVCFSFAFFFIFHRIHAMPSQAIHHHVIRLHWYDPVGILIYYSLCNVLLKLFNLGCIIYLDGLSKHTMLSVAQSLKKAYGHWRYMFWDVLIGTPLVFFLNLLSSISENAWRFLARSLGNLEKTTAFFLLPVVALENRNGLDALRRSSELLRLKVKSEQSLTLGLLDLLLFFPIVVALYEVFFISELSLRIKIAIGIILYVVGVVMFRSLLHVTLRTMAYFGVVTGKVPQGFSRRLLNYFIPKSI